MLNTDNNVLLFLSSAISHMAKAEKNIEEFYSKTEHITYLVHFM